MSKNDGTTRAPHAGSEVLVVDDVRENLRLLVRLLAEQGYKVRPISNGRMALTAAQIAPPDLILLDILMPELDGYQVCQQLKADEITRHIPVIFISALHQQMDIVRAFAVGGVDYITKPFQTEETLARVHTHLTIGKLQKELAQKNQALQAQNEALQQALHNIKTLSGLLPICANCKKIRDDDGYWHTVEAYIRDHSDAILSHGICPDCMTELYPDYER